MTPAPSPETRAAQRRATYDFNVTQAALCRSAQAGAGRWCLTALLVVHAGALALMAVEGVEGASSARCWAAAGLALTLLAGLAAWANFSLAAIVHTHWADDRLLDPTDSGEIAPPRLKRVADLAWALSLAFAAGAAAAAPVALLALSA